MDCRYCLKCQPAILKRTMPFSLRPIEYQAYIIVASPLNKRAIRATRYTTGYYAGCSPTKIREPWKAKIFFFSLVILYTFLDGIPQIHTRSISVDLV